MAKPAGQSPVLGLRSAQTPAILHPRSTSSPMKRAPSPAKSARPSAQTNRSSTPAKRSPSPAKREVVTSRDTRVEPKRSMPVVGVSRNPVSPRSSTSKLESKDQVANKGAMRSPRAAFFGAGRPAASSTQSSAALSAPASHTAAEHVTLYGRGMDNGEDGRPRHVGVATALSSSSQRSLIVRPSAPLGDGAGGRLTSSSSCSIYTPASAATLHSGAAVSVGALAPMASLRPARAQIAL